MPTKEKIPVTVVQRRSIVFDFEIPYWDQLRKVAKEILEQADVPDHASVTFDGESRIIVEWQTGDNLG